MNQPPSPPKPPNIQAELAKERNRAAAERTLMAWIRTSLSLIGFGFGIESIVNAITSFQAVRDLNRIRFSRLFGLSFIALGIYALVSAAIEHRQQLREIQRNTDYVYKSRRSLGLTVATGLICIGAFAFIAIIWKAIT